MLLVSLGCSILDHWGFVLEFFVVCCSLLCPNYRRLPRQYLRRLLKGSSPQNADRCWGFGGVFPLFWGCFVLQESAFFSFLACWFPQARDFYPCSEGVLPVGKGFRGLAYLGDSQRSQTGYPVDSNLANVLNSIHVSRLLWILWGLSLVDTNRHSFHASSWRLLSNLVSWLSWKIACIARQRLLWLPLQQKIGLEKARCDRFFGFPALLLFSPAQLLHLACLADRK